MRLPAFLGGGLSGLQNAGAWALAAGLAYAWQRHSFSRDNGAEMTAAQRDAFNAARKKETAAVAAEIEASAAAALAAAAPKDKA
jgi:hypothetical protein